MATIFWYSDSKLFLKGAEHGIDFNTDPAHSCSPVVISSKPEYRFMLREVNPAQKTDCNLYFKKCGTLESRELLPEEETS